MLFVNVPSKWRLTLTDDATVELWADSYSEEDGEFVFSLLVDAAPHEQDDLEVTARTPTRPERVIITVCRFPTVAVRRLRSAT
ncbi:MAG: hypothetical protein WBP59_08275 [Ilumatobacteraceae bacterium]